MYEQCRECRSGSGEQSTSGRYEVLVVPQIPDYIRGASRTRKDPDCVIPTSEMLLPVWVPDGTDPDALRPFGPIDNDAADHDIAALLQRRFPPHAIQPAQAAGYNPADYRKPDRRNMSAEPPAGFEWVTVVMTRGGIYSAMNDEAFSALTGEAREYAQVLGQTWRPANPDAPFMHDESRTLLGLFGLDERGDQQVLQPSGQYAAAA